ncbi:VPLPA-CTERM sorting domain-containing protein [Massilia sp. KIM]|uniref:VPLPA-CTERM sorting domain-containing protein n=1 Tax=Massilia sp. KIM TaxID=1955422 RepID=UPI00117D99AA|nr:VPLPA-CTERM sorting domain-containing protein [Massilia sp. KIM]
MMKPLLTSALAALSLLAAQAAHAGDISDSAVDGYWGGNDHGSGDVIGGSVYDIKGANITRVGDVLTIVISTNFAGHAGVAPNMASGGIGYGDLFLAEKWNPFGTDVHHAKDNASNGTLWEYGFALDNRFSNTGGTFKLYELNGATNAQNIRNTESFMSCKLGVDCTYREGQATGVKTSSSTVSNTGLVGTWKVLADQSLTFSINIANSGLANYSTLAMHWGETCQNDVIEGMTSLGKGVPLPGSLPLLAAGLGGMLLVRRRMAAAPR